MSWEDSVEEKKIMCCLCVDCRYGWWINASFLNLGFVRDSALFDSHISVRFIFHKPLNRTNEEKKYRWEHWWHKKMLDFFEEAAFIGIDLFVVRFRPFTVSQRANEEQFFRCSWIIRVVGWGKLSHYIDLRLSFRKKSANIIHQIWRVKNEKCSFFSSANVQRDCGYLPATQWCSAQGTITYCLFFQSLRCLNFLPEIKCVKNYTSWNRNGAIWIAETRNTTM